MKRCLLFLSLYVPTLAMAVPILLPQQGRILVGEAPFSGMGSFKFAIVSGPQGAEAATASPIVSNGFITGFTLENGGSNYATAPVVTITDSTGAGARAVATVVGGQVTALEVRDAGDGNYSSRPTVELSPPTGATYQTYWSNDGTSTGGGEPESAVSLDVQEGVYAVLLGDASLPGMTELPGGVFAENHLQLRIWFNDGVNGFQRLRPDQRLGASAFAARAGTADAVAEGAVNDAALADGAVTAGKIAQGAVTGRALAPGAVGAEQLAAGTVGTDALVAGAVGTAQLADGAITREKLAEEVLESQAPSTRALDEAGSPLGRVLVGPEATGSGTRFILVADVPASDFVGKDTGAGWAVLAHGGRVHLLAGPTPDTVDRIYLYDPDLATWSEGPALPTPRTGAAALAVGETIVVVGGENAEAPGTYPSGVWIYDPATEAWALGADFPEPRTGLALLAAGGKIHAIGGENPAGFSDRVDVYDPVEDAWRVHSTLPEPLARPGAIVFDGVLGIAGGESEQGVLDRGYWYDTNAAEWQVLPAQTEASEGRLRPQMLGIEDRGNALRGVFVVGGINAAGERSKAVDYFRRGNDFYLIPANGGERPAYSGAIYEERRAYLFGGSSLWRAVPMATDVGAEVIPALRREPGDASYWRNRLNATPTLDLQNDYRLALLQLDAPSPPPEIQLAEGETVPFDSAGDSVQIGLSGNASLYATNLPGGLTLDRESGVLSGTPTQRGTYEIDLIATGPEGSDLVTVTLAPADVEITVGPTAEFTGGPTPPVVTTDPAGVSTLITYNGSPTPPTSEGVHAYEVTVIAEGYSGSATGTYEIVPRPLTVTADQLSRVEGEADPALTYTVDNLPAGVSPADALSGGLAREAGESPGTYTISRGDLRAVPGFTVDSFREGSLTIESFAEFVTIPAGSFQRGDVQGVVEYSNARPAHEVFVSAFDLQTTEVTNQQLVSVFNEALREGELEFVQDLEAQNIGVRMATADAEGEKRPLLGLENNRALRKVGGQLVVTEGYEDRPVLQLGWHGAMAYCHFLNEREGLPSGVNLQDWTLDFSQPGYRLPTEAEWEKAARGGLEGRNFPWGDVIGEGDANYEWNGTFYENGFWFETTRVGSYPANGYGLYDMAGNVAEWVYDWYDSDFYSQDAATAEDPTGPTTPESKWNKNKVKRGGSYSGDPIRQTVFDRDFQDSTVDINEFRWGIPEDVGFRPARRAE